MEDIVLCQQVFDVCKDKSRFPLHKETTTSSGLHPGSYSCIFSKMQNQVSKCIKKSVDTEEKNLLAICALVKAKQTHIQMVKATVL